MESTVQYRVAGKPTIVDGNKVKSLMSVFDPSHAFIVNLDLPANDWIRERSWLVGMDCEWEAGSVQPVTLILVWFGEITPCRQVVVGDKHAQSEYTKISRGGGGR